MRARYPRLLALAGSLVVLALLCWGEGWMAVAATPATVKACRTSRECNVPEELCAKVAGKCNEAGACKPRPKECPQVVAPVCGCNEKTYDNECQALREGVNVAHAGKCTSK